MPTTKAEHTSFAKTFLKIRRDIAPLVKAEADRLNFHREDTLNLMAAQNAGRFAMEVILRECLPYDRVFLAELGVRLAAYAVTAAPIQDHDTLIASIQNALPRAVAEKVAQGAVIRSTWEQDGVERPNIPSASARTR